MRQSATTEEAESPPVVAEMAPTSGMDAQSQAARETRHAWKRPHVGTSASSLVRNVAAVTATTLGLISVAGSLFTFWAAIPAAIGLVLGLLGLRGAHRHSALVGLLLCCAALSFCMIRSVVRWQTQDDLQRQREIYGDEF